jgi:hypothetical protein
VTFHNADTGFAVLKVKARGRRELVPLVGHAATISAGEYVHTVGIWVTDRTHGLQFKADVLKTTPPTTTEGMARYLESFGSLYARPHCKHPLTMLTAVQWFPEKGRKSGKDRFGVEYEKGGELTALASHRASAIGCAPATGSSPEADTCDE